MGFCETVVKAGGPVPRKLCLHFRGLITGPPFKDPYAPQGGLSAHNQPLRQTITGALQAVAGRDWGGRPSSRGSLGQPPATAWGSEQNSCRPRGSEAMVCLRRFSTEAPAARRKRPWGARGNRRGSDGRPGRTPRLEALARSLGLCPHPVWWAEWGPRGARLPSTLEVWDLARSGGRSRSGGEMGASGRGGAEGRKEPGGSPVQEPRSSRSVSRSRL